MIRQLSVTTALVLFTLSTAHSAEEPASDSRHDKFTSDLGEAAHASGWLERTVTAQAETPAVAPSMGNTAVDQASPARMSEADCDAAWVSADADKNGELNDAEKERYVAASRVSNHPVATDVTLTKEVFLENCIAGYFATPNAPEEGAPFEGANSFTEDQARDRVLAAGYSEVSSMSKDDKGIWRGTARSTNGEVAIAVDFKGNVVPGQK